MSIEDSIFSFFNWGITSVLDYIKSGGDLGLAFIFVLSFLLLYVFMNWGKLILTLAYIPVLLIDLSTSYGSYTFKFPGIGEYTTQHGVKTLSLIDYIFNFGIFKDWGLEVFDKVDGAYALTGIQKIIVLLYVWSDTLIIFSLIAFAIYYTLSGVDNKFSLSLLLGAVGAIGYSFFVSNPLRERVESEKVIQHALYFLDKASQDQMITVWGSILISFVIIVTLISSLTYFLYTIIKSTARPGLEASVWERSFTGVAFGLAFIYSTFILLHPEYSWYVAFPVLIFINIISDSLRGHANTRRERSGRISEYHEAMRSYDRRY